MFLSGQNSRSVYDADAVQHWIWHLGTYKPERRGSNIKKGQTLETIRHFTIGPSDLAVMFLVQHDWLEGIPFSFALAKSYHSNSYLSFSITKCSQLIFLCVLHLSANPYAFISMSLTDQHILVIQKQSSTSNPQPLCSLICILLIPTPSFFQKECHHLLSTCCYFHSCQSHPIFPFCIHSTHYWTCSQLTKTVCVILANVFECKS